MLTVTIDLSDDEVTAMTAEVAAIEPQPTVAEYVIAAVRRHVIAPIVDRQAQYRVGRVVKRLYDSGLANQLALLPPKEQDAIQAMVATAVAAKLKTP
jgi:hypothetical protein